MKRLALIGASGHGKVIADIAVSLGINEIDFYDDRFKSLASMYKFSVKGSVSDGIKAATNYDFVTVSIGNSETREQIQASLPRKFPALIHPTACVSPTATLGAGTVVMPHAVINADARIGDGVIINSGAVVEHDCIIEDYVHICPGTALAGGVQVGRSSWIGIGSSVIQLVHIGKNVTVGAGSVVLKNIEDGQIVAGAPAKPLNKD